MIRSEWLDHNWERYSGFKINGRGALSTPFFVTMRLKEIIKILDNVAPFDLAEEWDNCGLMVGDPEQEISAIMVALDPLQAVVEADVDLIITHHPLFFGSIQALDLSEPLGRKVATLMQNRTALVAMHTNLDKAAGGVADQLALKLRLQGLEHDGFLRTGRLKQPDALKEWVKKLGTEFNSVPRVVDGGRAVSMVGLCPGSGMEFWRQAHAYGCDTFVTGDVRYHQALEASEAGMNVVDLGHFDSEELVVKALVERLSAHNLDVRPYEAHDIFER